MKTESPMQSLKGVISSWNGRVIVSPAAVFVSSRNALQRCVTRQKTAAREISRVKPTAHFWQPNIPSCSSMIAFSLSDSEKYFSCASLHFFFAISHSFLNVSISLLSTRFIEFCTKNERKYSARCLDKGNWEYQDSYKKL